MLNRVFQDLNNDKRCKNNYIRVYLNGNVNRLYNTMTKCYIHDVGFVHINDRLALLDIARQLDVEDDLGEHISVLME